MTDSDAAEARETVVDALARSAELYGAKRSTGRLYGILFFADEPMSLDEIAEESGYAKSTVSTTMSTLERFHMVTRRSLPGEGKKAFFEAETDFWYVLQQFLGNEVMREITIMTRALDGAVEILESAEGEQAARDLEKVRRLQTLYERSERAIRLLTDSRIDSVKGLLGRLTGNGGDEK